MPRISEQLRCIFWCPDFQVRFGLDCRTGPVRDVGTALNRLVGSAICTARTYSARILGTIVIRSVAYPFTANG